MRKPIRVLICDDSALMRRILSDILSAAPGIEVVGTASDPLIAREMIKAKNPDVLTLDVEMPRMDGLSFLEKLMTLRPMPVVMVSSLTERGADVTIRALELGALDVVTKPSLDMKAGMAGLADDIVAKVRAAAGSHPRAVRARAAVPSAPQPLAAAAGPVQSAPVRRSFRTTQRLIAIGASTGGVEALRDIICTLPPDSPAILIVQHMPERFTASFAARLNSLSALTVAEASDGARLLQGHVYLAPGGRHLRLARSGAAYHCAIDDGPPVSGHRPSVDVLFHSVAQVAGSAAIGVILTGMGRDGADGLAAMRAAGAVTFGQDEASSVVYGMPRAAMLAGGVQHELPLSRIAEEMIRAARDTVAA